jgi:GntR family transcriptional regulator
MAGGPEYGPNGEMQFMYEQVAADLERKIRAGELARGARLPGERALAGEYGIAIGTARKAVALLRDKGLVRTRAALGTFVARELPPQSR